MKRYYKIKLALPCFNYRDGNHRVEVQAIGRGLLAIHPPTDSVKEGYRTPARNLTHIPSGLSLGSFSGVRAAQAVLEQIIDLCDWRIVHQTGFTLDERARLTEIVRAQ